MLQVAHQVSCRLYEEPVSALWMARSPSAQEGATPPVHALFAQPGCQMVARPAIHLVGTSLAADTLL